MNDNQLLDMTFRFENFAISVNRLLNGDVESYMEWIEYSKMLIFDQYRRKYPSIYGKRIFAVIRLYMNDFSIKDIDNYIKAPLDALKGTVIKDDETVDLLIVYKLKGKPYKSSILELQICDMEKPIILSELIPKTDYIWMREKNGGDLHQVYSSEKDNAADGTGNKFDKKISKWSQKNENFKKLLFHFCGNHQLSKEQRKSYFNSKRMVALCALLLNNVEHNGGTVAQNYKSYREYLFEKNLSGATMSKADFEIWYNGEYKQEAGS